MAGAHELAKLTGQKQEVITDVFDALLNLVRSGERVTIRGFGSFFEVTRGPRVVKSPVLKNGFAPVREAKVLRFRPAGSTRRVIKASAKAKKRTESVESTSKEE